ncbi:MAG: endonuclease III [Clostridia bacterium]|nr:endonuclease III [Clostridia bacterium]
MQNNIEILARLKAAYPDARPELYFVNAYECMAATILSAQCTDKQVNKVTPALFAAYPTPADMARAQPEDLIPYIKTCGFFNNKAKGLVGACRRIMEQHGGEVPGTLEDLRALPGVGQKTANVIYANAFHGDAIAVDTHVFRVANRLGLAHASTPEKTEEDLKKVIPQQDWSAGHHWLLFHGRRVCRARKPLCGECFLRDLCPSAGL